MKESKTITTSVTVENFSGAQPRDSYGRWSSGGGGGGGTKMAPDTGGGSGGSRVTGGSGGMKELDGEMGAAVAASDFKKVVEVEQKILSAGPKPNGFQLGENGTRLYKRSTNVKDDANDVRVAMKKAGYNLTAKAKMMGGSETIETFRHPDHPNYSYKFHMSPRTRQGVREAQMDLSISPKY